MITYECGQWKKMNWIECYDELRVYHWPNQKHTTFPVYLTIQHVVKNTPLKMPFTFKIGWMSHIPQWFDGFDVILMTKLMLIEILGLIYYFTSVCKQKQTFDCATVQIWSVFAMYQCLYTFRIAFNVVCSSKTENGIIQDLYVPRMDTFTAEYYWVSHEHIVKNQVEFTRNSIILKFSPDLIMNYNRVFTDQRCNSIHFKDEISLFLRSVCCRDIQFLRSYNHTVPDDSNILRVFFFYLRYKRVFYA